MNKFIAFLVAVFTLAHYTSAQETAITLITTDSNRTELRPNIDNIIRISPLPRRAKISIDGSTPSVDGGMQSIGDGRYILRVSQGSNYRRIAINVWHEGQILVSKTFGISIQGPEVWFAGVRDYMVSAQTIRANPVVQVFHNGQECSVVRFQFSAAPKRGEYFGPFLVEGPRLSDANLLAYLSRRIAGDKIFLTDIETQCKSERRAGMLPKLEAVILVVR